MKISKNLEKLSDFIFLKVINDINWKWARKLATGRSHGMLIADKLAFDKAIDSGEYFICLTRQSSYLTTLLISAANKILFRKPTYYTHALMIEKGVAFEATAKGTHISSMSEVLECDGAVLLMPKNMTKEFWGLMFTEARRNLGKPYDSLFDLTNDEEISCIEYILDCLAEIPGNATKWPSFIGLARKAGNITPQALYDSGDFEVILEIRR